MHYKRRSNLPTNLSYKMKTKKQRSKKYTGWKYCENTPYERLGKCYMDYLIDSLHSGQLTQIEFKSIKLDRNKILGKNFNP